MTYVIAALVLLSVVTALNLLLMLGVIRRLRTHTAMLAAGGGSVASPGLIPAGERVGGFTATTVDGEPVSRDVLTGDTVVAFMKPGCPPCEENLPAFLQLARDTPGGRHRVLAVVAGTAAEAAPMVAQLGPVSQVLFDPEDGPMARAFEVSGYPVYYVIGETGVVRSSAYRPQQIQIAALA